MSMQQVQVPWRPGFDIGVGADLLSGGPLASVVEGQPTQVQQSGGSTVNFELQRIHTTSDLERSLGIDVDASYGCAAFGAGVSARFDFAKNSRIQSSSLFMTVTATVGLGFLQIDAPTLNAGAAALVDQPDQFAARYGNVFVRGLARGGLYVGVLRIDTHDDTESETISTELEGSYGLFSADAQAKFAQLEQEHHSEIFVQMFHEGGPVDLKITDPTDPNQLLANANAFLQSFADRPDTVAVPYQVTLAPMAVAVGPPPLNEADIAHAQDVLVFCAHRRSAVLDQLNLMQFIADNTSRFDFPPGVSPGTVQQAVTGYQADLDLIAQCASSAINTPRGAAMPADFAAQRGILFPQGVAPAVMPTPKPAAPNLVIVPDWGFLEDVYNAGVNQDGTPGPATAASLGLTVTEVDTQTGTGDIGDIMNIQPPPGTQIPRGSVVTITVQRNPGPHDQ